jgi:hypothetical protein
VTKPDADLGMFLGKKAKNADLKKLARANQMVAEGLPREEIWKETGWWEKPDGQWAFEINDSAFNFQDYVWEILEEPPRMDEATHQPKGNSWTSVGNTSGSHNEFMDEAAWAIEHPELIDNYRFAKPDDVENIKTSTDNQVLNEIAGKPTLHVENVDLMLGEELPASGAFSPKDKRVSATGSNKDNLLGVATHELQHAVQDTEGWPGWGSNLHISGSMERNVRQKAPKAYRNYETAKADWVNKAEDIKYYQKERDQWKQALEEAKTSEDRKEARDMLDNINFQIDRSKLYQTELYKNVQELYNAPEVQEFDLIFKSFQERFGSDEYEIYKNNEGEAIADIANLRRTFTDKERQAIPPWEHFGQERSMYGESKRKLPVEEQIWTQDDFVAFMEKMFPEEKK